MTRDSASETDYKRRLAALQKEKEALELSLSKLKKEKYALADQLHLQEKAAEVTGSGWLVWNIDTAELDSHFPWELLMVGHEAAKKPSFEEIIQRLLPADQFRVKRLTVELTEGIKEQDQLLLKVENTRGDAVPILVNVATLPDENGKPRLVTASLMLLKRTLSPEPETSLLEIDQLPLPVFRVGLQSGEPVYLNHRALKVVEKQLGDQEFQHISELVGVDVWTKLEETTSQDNSPADLEVNLSGGQSFLISAQASGEHLDILLHDTGELKQSVKELQQLNVQLDNFVYHASHDLRAPLRTVLGLLDVLRAETNKEQRERCVNLIEGSIKRLDSLVVDLLSISRNKRAANPLVKINFMVEVNQAISSFYHLGNTRNLEIRTLIRQPKAFVGDLTRVRIVLNNVISNAIKYRRYGPDVSFVEIRIQVDDTAASIEIEDNGEGIPETSLPQIFDMFYRASDSSEGSGLGLYIVRDVLQKLEGSIEVTSTYGRGSLFKVMIPNRQ